MSAVPLRNLKYRKKVLDISVFYDIIIVDNEEEHSMFLTRTCVIVGLIKQVLLTFCFIRRGHVMFASLLLYFTVYGGALKSAAKN